MSRLHNCAWILATFLAWQPLAAASGTGHGADEPLPPPQDRISPKLLMGTLAALPEQRSAWGDVAHRRGLVEAERMLVGMLEEVGHEPELHLVRWIHSRGDEGPYHNIIVDVPGRTKPEEVLLIGAHFDAVPNSPGADDNGTGTAALMELARVLPEYPMQRTVRLVFFNLEELGMVGSGQYAQDLGERIRAGEEEIVGMVSMDMLGYFSDEPGSQKNPLGEISGVEIPTVGDFIALGTIRAHREFVRAFDSAMREASPGLKTFVADHSPVAAPDLLRSDHAPFMAMGIPAFILTDTANFRNPHYHRPSDTIETIDVERYVKVVRGVAGAVYVLAGSAEGEAAGGGADRSANETGSGELVRPLPR